MCVHWSEHDLVRSLLCRLYCARCRRGLRHPCDSVSPHCLSLTGLSRTDSWHLTWCHIIARPQNISISNLVQVTGSWLKSFWGYTSWGLTLLGPVCLLGMHVILWAWQGWVLPEWECKKKKGCVFVWFCLWRCSYCYHALTKCSGNAEQTGVLAVQTFVRAALD